MATNPEERFYEWELGKSIPDWANQRLQEMPNCDFVEVKPADVPIEKLVGTSHERYSGSTWLEALNGFKRKSYDADRVKSIDYRVLNELPLQDGIDKGPVVLVYVEEEDKYYISHGNHRMILVKLRGDERVRIKNVHVSRRRPQPPAPPVIELTIRQEPTGIDKILLSVFAAFDRILGRN